MAHPIQPQIPQQWIYTMIISGWIGVIVHLAIISIAIFHNCQKKKKHSQAMQFQILLNFTIWICNFIACFEWATVRTSLFFPLSVEICKISYISNYLFYMMGKYALHILLLYRLHFVFRKTYVRFRKNTLYLVFAVITINFIVFSSFWLDSALDHVIIGVVVPDRALEICTLFNSSQETLHPVDRVWPILLGGQDLIIGLFTLCLFFYKGSAFHRGKSESFYDMHKNRIAKLVMVMRKLFVLGTISIASTFLFYTFAIPFYGNLTFLLPVDACINSICTILLLKYAHPAYKVLCCGCDRGARLMCSIEREKQMALSVNQTSNVSKKHPISLSEDYRLHSALTASVTSTPNKSTTSTSLEIKPSKPRKKETQLRHFKSASLNYAINKETDINVQLHSVDDLMPLEETRNVRSSFF